MQRTNGRESMRVCVVSENCLARFYLLQLLHKDSGVKPITLDDLLASRWALNPPKVFVVDRCGLTIPLCECLGRLRRRYPSARFLVLGSDYEKDEVVRLMFVGVHGFLEQKCSPELLLRAVRCVAEGQVWVAPDVLEAYLREAAVALRRSEKRGAAFTPRETEILQMVRSRLSNREIAGFLKIRVSTVKFHLTNILSKQHAGGRRDLFTPLHSEIWNKLSP
jgi:DNA-binding NarL/FixJ family response regulator